MQTNSFRYIHAEQVKILYLAANENEFVTVVIIASRV